MTRAKFRNIAFVRFYNAVLNCVMYILNKSSIRHEAAGFIFLSEVKKIQTEVKTVSSMPCKFIYNIDKKNESVSERKIFALREKRKEIDYT